MASPMSYNKASDLLRVADLAARQTQGVSLRDVEQEFDCNHRTAQRIMRAFETVFRDYETVQDEERRQYWRLTKPGPALAPCASSDGCRACRL